MSEARTERLEVEAELKRAWARKLRQYWHHYNVEYLKEALVPPTMRIADGDAALGRWDGNLREIAISARHILRDPWSAVTETLRHEMAHQYAQEVLEATGERPHGEAFRDACRRLRCDAAPSASPEEMAEAADDALLRRLKKLLSLAGSPNENEAQAAMQKARRLLVKYNIDLVELDRERHYEWRILGALKGRHTTAELWMASLLQRFFFVETLWAHSYDARTDRAGTELQIYGTPENLDMAEYVHGYLTQLLEDLWTAYKQENGIRANRERQRFYAGVLEGFFGKLANQETRMAETEALVWKGDAQLKSFYRRINPNVYTRYGGGVSQTEAYSDGVEAGKKVTIHRPVKERGSGGGLLE